MLTKRTIIIISIAVLVAAGLAVALLLTNESFFLPKSQTTAPAANEPTDMAATPPSPAKGLTPIEPAVTLTPLEQNLTVISRNFAERYGSFSTDSNFNNLDEVRIISTARMQTELAQLKSDNQRGSSASSPLDYTRGDLELVERSGQEFYGVSSRAMKVEILNSDETSGQAEVLVSLQREESRAGQDNFVYYQDLKLSLVKSGDNWLVDSAEWQ